ncbi:TonB-dependent receptor [Phenylobacterium aquaticum]|uniref:TonB-dependent receptor n=1 Tax=Phenylobacterium aquaticum TaxID=1763816 RepID=UPI001F5DA63C|nr:TonB-dependent receptor plug domain-containing protein [Phenylobacterium aquaticum]MCI3135191.1 TonB-dependent receptor plug domain-containing protein [Phenylobacterium aquaticum]
MGRNYLGCASVAAIAFALSASAGGTAWAADAPAASAPGAATELTELVVTARKREERLRDIPTAATAFGTEQLRNIGGIANTQSLLSNVPGVNFANTSNPVTSEVSMRGSGTSRATAAESGVGLYRNGAYAGGGYQGGRTFSKADFFDVQGIEVLRGVQGALNGRNAVGGSVNVVTARPVQGQESGFFTGDIATKEHREGQLVVNQPLTDNLALRVGVDVMRQDKGFYYSPYTKEYFDAQKTDTYRVQLGYRNGPITANILAEHGADTLPGLMYSVNIPPGVSAIYPKGIYDDKYNISWNSPSTAKMRTNYYEFVGGYDLDFATVTLTSSLRERHSQNAYDRDATSPQFEAAAAAAGLVAKGAVQGDPNLGGLTLDFSRILFNDIHIAGNKTGKWSWLAGAELYDLNDKAQIILSKSSTGTTAATLSPGTDQVVRIDFTSWAAYGSVGYDLTDALNLTGELRSTNDDKSIVSARLDYGTGLPSGTGYAFSSGKTSDNLSYNVTLAYKVGNWLTYGKVGSAYRAGGFNLALGDPRAPKTPPAAYDDEVSTSFEVGAKGNITRSLFVNAAAYRVNVSDLLVQTDNGCFVGSSVCPVQATPYVYNSGNAELSGVEVEVTMRARLAGGVALVTLGASHQTGKVVSGPDKGKETPQRPDYTGTLNLNYRRPLVDGLTGFVNVKGNLRSGGVQEIAQTPRLHDFQTYDLRLGVTKDKWEAAFYMNNFANESYIVFDSASVRRWNFPQSYGAQLSYRW